MLFLVVNHDVVRCDVPVHRVEDKPADELDKQRASSGRDCPGLGLQDKDEVCVIVSLALALAPEIKIAVLGVDFAGVQ